MQLLTTCLEQLCNVDATILIPGDFNIPTIHWTNQTLDGNHTQPTCSEIFLLFCNEQALCQLVNDVTRPIELNPNTGNILDLVLTNDGFAVQNLEIRHPFSTSDHFSLSFMLYTAFKSPYSANMSRPFKSQYINWAGINNFLSNSYWTDIFDNCNYTKEFFEACYKEINICLDQFVPITNFTKCAPGNTKYPSNITKLQSRKLIARTLYRTHHSMANVIRFKNQHRNAESLFTDIIVAKKKS